MAQSQVPTAEGFAEICNLVSGAGGTEVESVCAYSGTCTIAHQSSTFASPANGAGAIHIVGNGLSLANADTVVRSTTMVTNDTCELDHVFTASGSETVTGFCIANNADSIIFAECCFNAGVAMVNSDTLTVEMKMQFKLGA